MDCPWFASWYPRLEESRIKFPIALITAKTGACHQMWRANPDSFGLTLSLRSTRPKRRHFDAYGFDGMR